MNYKSKFALNYILFMVAIGALVNIIGNIIVASLLATVLKETDMTVQTVMKSIITTLLSLLVMYLGVGSAAKYAAKKEDIPEYDDMKKFAILFFGILALIQLVYSAFEIVNMVNEANAMIEGTILYKQEYQEYLNKAVAIYGIFTVVLVVGQLLMIPVTLKKYDV